MIILDTNVISEAMRPNPDERVTRWLRFAPSADLFTTAVTEAEMRYGAQRRHEGRKKRELEELVERVFSMRFAGHILPFDSAAARAFPPLLTEMQRHGRAYSTADAQIAAIARAHGATVATRNTTDFELAGIAIVNPWET
jgi:predicted nucleic acid-binding protein